TESTTAASAAFAVSVVTQSRLRHAGRRPRVLQRPRVGLNPTRLLNAAGTRPEPAVSEPSATGTTPAATSTADPELEPPLTYSRLKTHPGLPYGLRVPTRPVANWSMLVLPMITAPAASKRSITWAEVEGRYANTGQAA